MSAARDLVREAFRTEEHGLEWRAGIAGAVATIGPLAIGIASGEAVLGLIGGIGGLNTSLCVPGAGLRSRLWWGSLAAVSDVAAFALANVVRDYEWAVVVVTLLWVSGWAFTRAAGRAGAILGFATAAVFVVLCGIPASPEPFGERLLWFSLGAIAGLVLTVAARRGPEPSKRVVRDSLRAVRQAVTGRDSALRAHAARLGLAVAASTLFYLVIDLAHGYWVPLTTLAILQPEERATRVRSVQRAVGTLAGAGLIIAITFATHEPWALAAGARCGRLRPVRARRAWLLLARGADHTHGPVHAEHCRLPGRRRRPRARSRQLARDSYRARFRRGGLATLAEPRRARSRTRERSVKLCY